MTEAGILFHLFSFLLAILASVSLLVVNKEQKHFNRILAWFLILCSIVNLNNAILYGGWFVKIPIFHKVVLPFTLLMTPLSYIYLRSVLMAEFKFRRYDWLILLPCVLCTINLMPYYLMPLELKQAYLVKFYNSVEIQGRFDEGMLPAYFFNFLRVGWSSIFIVLNFRLLGRFKKIMISKELDRNKELLNWLTLFNWLVTSVLISALVGAFLVTTHRVTLSITDVVLGIAVMVMCFKLFMTPKLLYGLYIPSVNTAKTANTLFSPEVSIPDFEKGNLDLAINHQSVDPESNIIISNADSIRYKTILETFFQQQQPFLELNYSLQKLVSDINIPRHILSAFINKEYGIGFREFLNRYRVNYIIANRLKDEWKLLTLEAIGMEAGFKNRTTFIRQFKKATGIAPSLYLKFPKLQENHINNLPINPI